MNYTESHKTYDIEAENLVDLILKGDKAALNSLLETYRPMLYWQALRIVRNAEDAEDVIQDAFLKALCHLNQFERRSKFSTWLTRVVINTALMARRSKRSVRGGSRNVPLSTEKDEHIEPIEIADSRPDPEQICASSEIGAAMSEQLDRLSPSLRPAFELHFIHGLSCEEASVNLGISTSAAKTRVRRARRQLASRLNHAYSGAASRQTLPSRGPAESRPLANEKAGS